MVYLIVKILINTKAKNNNNTATVTWPLANQNRCVAIGNGLITRANKNVNDQNVWPTYRFNGHVFRTTAWSLLNAWVIACFTITTGENSRINQFRFMDEPNIVNNKQHLTVIDQMPTIISLYRFITVVEPVLFIFVDGFTNVNKMTSNCCKVKVVK